MQTTEQFNQTYMHDSSLLSKSLLFNLSGNLRNKSREWYSTTKTERQFLTLKQVHELISDIYTTKLISERTCLDS